MNAPSHEKPARKSSSRLWAVALGALLAVATVVVYAVVSLIVASGPRLKEIDQADFQAARQRWQEHGPDSYDIEVAVDEMQQVVYRVQVRDGEVTSATRDGAPLTNRRTLGVWSVPGMFNTISIDLEHAEEPIRVGPKEVHYVSPLARFHPRYGYPERYRRIEWGSDVEASWQVTEFRVVE